MKKKALKHKPCTISMINLVTEKVKVRLSAVANEALKHESLVLIDGYIKIARKLQEKASTQRDNKKKQPRTHSA